MSEPLSGWWTTAKAGDKIVCVDNGWVLGNSDFYPVKGNVYEFLCVDKDKIYREGELRCPFVVLANRPLDNLFAAICFRPVQAKPTDAGMAVFKEILDRETLPTFAPAKVQA